MKGAVRCVLAVLCAAPSYALAYGVEPELGSREGGQRDYAGVHFASLFARNDITIRTKGLSRHGATRYGVAFAVAEYAGPYGLFPEWLFVSVHPARRLAAQHFENLISGDENDLERGDDLGDAFAFRYLGPLERSTLQVREANVVIAIVGHGSRTGFPRLARGLLEALRDPDIGLSAEEGEEPWSIEAEALRLPLGGAHITAVPRGFADDDEVNIVAYQAGIFVAESEQNEMTFLEAKTNANEPLTLYVSDERCRFAWTEVNWE